MLPSEIWLLELFSRFGQSGHVSPTAWILEILHNGVWRRCPRHGRLQISELTIYLFFGHGLAPEMLYITLKILIYYLFKQRQAFFSGASSSSSSMQISLKIPAWRAESSGSQLYPRLGRIVLSASSSCLPPGSTPDGSHLFIRSQSCRRYRTWSSGSTVPTAGMFKWVSWC